MHTTWEKGALMYANYTNSSLHFNFVPASAHLRMYNQTTQTLLKLQDDIYRLHTPEVPLLLKTDQMLHV